MYYIFTLHLIYIIENTISICNLSIGVGASLETVLLIYNRNTDDFDTPQPKCNKCKCQHIKRKEHFYTSYTDLHRKWHQTQQRREEEKRAKGKEKRNILTKFIC